MLMAALARGRDEPVSQEQRTTTMIAYLRSVVLAPPATHERGHAIFVDRQSAWLGDAPCGIGTMGTLGLRMRALLGDALRFDAAGIILAHSHPSGHCRPSGCDIAATRRLGEVASALDIKLIDHLIFTTDAVYSMRAGGLL
ncbi:JAB domain-containing protein [Porphyrobacter sp. ULC335]|jgi:DNA repair protein RadC|uniref:JAB domain-containing protein n=1 Tax=Porphyrobacter sp. ULC335 TaxID=2854260 RepID=UPI002220C19D|nr:JAB domain-containing protein [Porphyrobacter sp. ULC335]UYV16898.1 DNA repair protein [Porphyrobacter sp. ULC335]